MRLRLCAFLALALAACDQSDVAGPPRKTEAAGVQRPEATAIAGPGGWGSVRIGMSRTQAVEAMGGVRGELPPEKTDFGNCYFLRPAGVDGVLVMIENGRVGRIDISEGAPPTVTDTGLTLGAEEAAVRARYDASLEAEPHRDEQPPAGYLTWWNPRTRQGIRYVVGPDGRVGRILIGGESIRHGEGCA